MAGIVSPIPSVLPLPAADAEGGLTGATFTSTNTFPTGTAINTQVLSAPAAITAAFASQVHLGSETIEDGTTGQSLTAAGDDFTADEKHLIFMQFQQHSTNHLSSVVEANVDGGEPLTDRRLLTNSDHSYTTPGAYCFLQGAWIETPSTSVAIENTGARDAATLNQSIVMINVDDWVDGADYAQASTDVGGVELTTSYVEQETLAFTPSASDEEWLIITTVAVDPGSNTHAYAQLLDDDDNVVWDEGSCKGCNYQYQSHESVLSGVYLFTSSDTTEQTFKVQCKGRTSGNYLETVIMLAIRLDSLGSNRKISQPAKITSSITSATEIAEVTLDESPTGDVLLLGWYHADTTSTSTVAHNNWFSTDDNTTTLPADHDTANNQNHSGENQDVEVIPAFRTYVDEGGSDGPTYQQWAIASTANAEIENIFLMALEIGSGAGSVFTSSNTWPTGAIQPQPVTVPGALFTSTNTWPTGAATSGQNLNGVLFSSGSTFPAGTVAGPLTGALFSSGNSFTFGAYFDLDGTTGENLTTPYQAFPDVDRLSAWATVDLTDWTPTNAVYVWSHKNSSFPNYFRVDTDGKLTLQLRRHFTTVVSFTSTASLPSLPAGAQIGFEFGFTDDNCAFYYRNTPADSWTQLGDVVDTNNGHSILNSSAVIRVGGFATSDAWRVYEVALIDETDIDGAPWIHMDAADWTTGSTFTSSDTGEVWTINGADDPSPVSGSVLSNYNIDGVLFQSGNTFFTGDISVPDAGQDLDGVLFSSGSTFPVGQTNLTIHGTPFSSGGSFYTGTLTAGTTLTGSLFQSGSTWPAGSVDITLNGVLFSSGSNWFAGALSSGYTITGTPFQSGNTFLGGIISQRIPGDTFSSGNTFSVGDVQPGGVSLTGALFSSGNAWLAGRAIHVLSGVLFASGNTFSTGQIDLTLQGVFFQSGNSFLVGEIEIASTLSGVLFSSGNTFPAGDINQDLAGVLFSSGNTFETGSLTSDYSLTGALFASTNTFPAGTVDQEILGGLFVSGNTFYSGDIQPGAATLTGSLFTTSSLFPAGLIDLRGLQGVLFPSSNTFPSGSINLAVQGALFTNTSTFPAGDVQPEQAITGDVFVSTNSFGLGVIAGPLTGALFPSSNTWPTGKATGGYRHYLRVITKGKNLAMASMSQPSAYISTMEEEMASMSQPSAYVSTMEDETVESTIDGTIE